MIMATYPFNLVVGSCLQFETPSDEISLPVTLIGYLEPHSVVISWPEREGVRMALEENDRVLLQFEAGDTQYQFESHIVRTCSAPYPYLHIAFPKGVNNAHGRRATRIPVNDMAMMLVMEENGHKMSVALADISMIGARLVASTRLGEIGDRFSIEIPHMTGAGNERVVLPCEVRYVREEMSINASKRVYHHGVEFTGLNRRARVFIEQYIGDKVSECRGAQG